jgi:hypothetical protein
VESAFVSLRGAKDHDAAVGRSLSDAGFDAFEDPLGRGA